MVLNYFSTLVYVLQWLVSRNSKSYSYIPTTRSHSIRLSLPFPGGLILPLLGALPDAAIIIFSGSFGSTESAQHSLQVGMGQGHTQQTHKPLSDVVSLSVGFVFVCLFCVCLFV